MCQTDNLGKDHVGASASILLSYKLPEEQIHNVLGHEQYSGIRIGEHLHKALDEKQMRYNNYTAWSPFAAWP